MKILKEINTISKSEIISVVITENHLHALDLNSLNDMMYFQVKHENYEGAAMIKDYINKYLQI